MTRSMKVDMAKILALIIVARFSCQALSNIPLFSMSFISVYIIAFVILFIIKNKAINRYDFRTLTFLLIYTIDVVAVTVPNAGLMNTQAFNAYIMLTLYLIHIWMQSKDEKKRISICKTALLGFAFTSVYSIVKLAEDPLLSRRAASRFMVNNTADTLNAVGGFDTVYGSLLLFVIVLFILAYGQQKKKLLLLGLCVSLVVFIVMATYATALVLLVGIMALFIYKRNKGLAIFVVSLMVILMISHEYLGDIIIRVSNEISYSDTMKEKISQVGYMIKFGESTGTLAGDDGRFARMSWSLNAFLASPIFGSFSNSSMSIGGHSEIMDTLGRFGLIGFASIAGFWISFIQQCIDRYSLTRAKECAAIVALIYIFTCVLNPGFYTQQVLPLIILLPNLELFM